MDVEERRPARNAVLGRAAGHRLPLIVRAEGVYLYDDQGTRYLDAVGGAGVAVLGHGDPRVLERLADQRRGMGFTYGAFFDNPWQEALAERLVGIAGLPAGGAVLTSGGTEANEVALKLARYAALARGESERVVVITRDRSYHGNTIAALHVSGRPSWRTPILPIADVQHAQVGLPYADGCPHGRTVEECPVERGDDVRETIERIGPHRVLAVMIEPIVGTSAPAVRPPRGYMERVRQTCDEYGVLLIADEVMCGHWRTGESSAMRHFGVRPDLTTIGKSLASGFAPLAACVASSDVREAVLSYTSGPLTHGFTFSGNPVSSALGLIVGELCDEDGLYGRPAQVGEGLLKRLTAWAAAEEVVAQVRGSGLLIGVEFTADPGGRAAFDAEVRFAPRVVERALELGLVVIPGIRDGTGTPAADHIQLTPPYVLTEAQADQLVDLLARATRDVKDEVAKRSRD